MIRVLVIDDHDLVRTGIRRMLADVAGIKVVGEGESGEDAIRLGKELQPDVILMDIKMPGIGGLETKDPWFKEKGPAKLDRNILLRSRCPVCFAQQQHHQHPSPLPSCVKDW